MGSSISASDNSATSYDGSAPNDSAATINSATVTAASAILVVGIAGASIVPAANRNRPPSNDRSAAIDGGSPVNGGSSVNGSASVGASRPDLHNLTVIQRNHEDAFGTGYGRADRLMRKKRHACDDPKQRLQCQVRQCPGHDDASFVCLCSRIWMNDATASLFPLSAERFARTTG